MIGSARTGGAVHDPRSEAELVQRVVDDALAAAGVAMADIDFTCSGSSDYLEGRPFAFVSALDGICAWPPIAESHVEMDGAWALYEAWVKIQSGQADTALIYAFGKPTAGNIDRVLCAQLDPYTMAPLWPGANAIAGLQARALLDAGEVTRDALDAIAVAHGLNVSTDGGPRACAPLRRHDVAPVVDGATAIVLAAESRAPEGRHAWIRGLAHRIEPHQLGLRPLARSASTAQSAESARAGTFDYASTSARTTAEHAIVADALGVAPTAATVRSLGFNGHTMMVAGLTAFADAAAQIAQNGADRAVAHATSGPALQQNLVSSLEAR